MNLSTLVNYRAFYLAFATVIAACTLWPTPSHASDRSCTVAVVRAAQTTGVTVGDVPDLAPGLPVTSGGVADVPAGYFGFNSPEECLVTGSIVTNYQTGKTANFAAMLPLHANWNRKFMFEGCNGNCGTITLAPTPNVLSKGYPVWATDDGHLGSDAAWPIRSPGVYDQGAIVDFAYRAVHEVVDHGKQFTLSFFGARKFDEAYYEGCSDGGREGMVEANRYPDDFDGVLAGDPYFDVPGQNIIIADITAQLQLKNALITPAQLAIASKIVMSQCDTADGVRDGLIQNPALCRFNPIADLPKCPAGSGRPDCFTLGQRQALWTILAGMTDSKGSVVHPGFPVSDLNTLPGANLAGWAAIATTPTNLTGPEPWPNGGAPVDWLINDPGLKYWAYAGEPGYNSVRTLGFTYHRDGPGPINVFHTTAPLATVERIYSTMNIASGDFPSALEPFIAKNKKLILYHGYSDGFITPYRTVQYYVALAALTHGFAPLQENVRLFMLPGMYHCNGGPGPNNFGQRSSQPLIVDSLHDATTALENWVEHAKAPQEFIATKFANDVTSAQNVVRTMPLCSFPAEAKYRGGKVADAANWSCAPHDASLLTVGFDGFEAGLVAPLYDLRPR